MSYLQSHKKKKEILIYRLDAFNKDINILTFWVINFPRCFVKNIDYLRENYQKIAKNFEKKST